MNDVPTQVENTCPDNVPLIAFHSPLTITNFFNSTPIVLSPNKYSHNDSTILSFIVASYMLTDFEIQLIELII